LLIADNNKIITAGGVTADKDLCMHLISKFCGHEIALQTARCTLVNRTSREQTQYKTFSIIKNNKFKEIVDCQIYIENHLKENITVQSLAQVFSLSQRTLTRRFKQATTHSLVSYIQQLKVEKAKYILERENKSFDYIANELGYENISFFRRLFKKYVGITPKEYKQSFFIE
jgi:transcriptional regulator GlxA family with amidase domain